MRRSGKLDMLVVIRYLGKWLENESFIVNYVNLSAATARCRLRINSTETALVLVGPT